MIKNIIFDVGAVLVDFRYHDLMVDLGFDRETIDVIEEKLIGNSELWGRLDLGIEPEEVTVERMLKEVSGFEPAVRIFFENKIDIVRTYPYTVPWLTSLREKGFKIYLLSNYPKNWWILHDEKRFGFTHLTDGKIVSGFVNMTKPHDEIYNCLFKTYNLNPDECLFFDDRKENIEGAVRNGMHGHVFVSYEDADNYLNELIKSENK